MLEAPRVSKRQQEWHLQPERVARDCAMFFGPDASIELTARTATLHYRYLGAGLGTMPETLQGRFALVLQGLYFDMEQVRLGDYRLVLVGSHADLIAHGKDH